ncbi:hypothetical protein DFH05DRAFT_1047861 [Lentinula detonsa]|uniref:Uncharacterized protein n=1 Tax=Lentinula detonsa TaxID=2804962 RepID=A0A9W8P339_9AGAR|nr:hypothetical protein DFH05DRAFT_1047861 [Lentinula detonsa]KAJ3986300.1 hypothetical protein F5890DRAFT_1504972 [Lentinula detonsa]
MIALETSVVLFTSIRTIQALRAGGPWKRQRHRLVFFIFEEGILYFCIATALTIATVILDLRAPTGFLQSLMDGLTLPLSGAFTARFILHLRAWRQNQSGVYIISTIQNQGESQQPSSPSHSDAINVDVEAIFRPVPSMCEFGEDPVARVLKQSESGTIVVQVDCQVSGGEDYELSQFPVSDISTGIVFTEISGS